MKFQIEEAARTYLLTKKKGIITIAVRMTGGGCCDTFEVEEIFYAPPSDVNNYHEFEQEGLTIYLGKNVRSPFGEIRLSLQKNLFTKSIKVEGLTLKKSSHH